MMKFKELQTGDIFTIDYDDRLFMKIHTIHQTAAALIMESSRPFEIARTIPLSDDTEVIPCGNLKELL